MSVEAMLAQKGDGGPRDSTQMVAVSRRKMRLYCFESESIDFWDACMHSLADAIRQPAQHNQSTRPSSCMSPSETAGGHPALVPLAEYHDRD